MNPEVPEVYIYENSERQFEVHCYINRLVPEIGIRGIKNEALFFDWNKLDLSNFEIIHAFMRILALIPDKVATAITINDECHEQDSGSYLIQLVVDLLKQYSDTQFQNRSPAVTNSLTSLSSHLETLITSLNRRNSAEITISSSIIINEIDCYYVACRLYVTFLHQELIRIQREGPQTAANVETEFINLTPTFVNFAQTLYNEKSLKSEFHELFNINQSSLEQ